MPANDEPIRILRVIARLNMGGPAIHVSNLAAGLETRGYHTTLVAGCLARGEDSMAFLADRLGIRVVGVSELQREVSPIHNARAVVKQDSEGNLIFVGRKKDMIIRGGQNIYPREIENIPLQHPCIRGVAVVAIPDRIMGEKACACLVLKDGVSLRREEVLEFFKSKKIAPFKLPERIEFFVELPLLGSLKVDKKALQSVVTRSEGG